MSLFGPPKVSELEKKGDVRGLIKALCYSGRLDYQVNEEAIQALLRLAPVQAVEPLIACMKNSLRSISLRCKAIEALGELRDMRAFLPLVNCLKSSEYSIRDASAQALFFFDDPRVLPALLDSCEKSSEIPHLAAQAIARYGDKSHIPLLISWLANKRKKTREQAAIALDHLGWQPTADEAGAYYWLEKGKYECCAKIGPQALKPMLVFSNSYESLDMNGTWFKNWMLRTFINEDIKVEKDTTAIVIRGAGNDKIYAVIMADERLSVPLLEIMLDTTLPLIARVNAGRLLVCMNDQRALEPLFSLLISPHKPYSEDIIWAISALKPADVEPYLSLLNHENMDTCISAIHLLAQLGSKRAIAPLIALLDDKQHMVVTKYEAIIALGQIGDTDVFEKLLQRLLKDNESEDIKRALMTVLKNKPDPRAFEPAYKVLCDSALYHSTREAAAGLLIALYQDNKLDDNAIKMLVPLRETIQGKHNDDSFSSDCGHVDNGKIGLDFPM
jgi:HEAT repeat protein